MHKKQNFPQYQNFLGRSLPGSQVFPPMIIRTKAASSMAQGTLDPLEKKLHGKKISHYILP